LNIRGIAETIGRKTDKSDFNSKMSLDAGQAARVRKGFDAIRVGVNGGSSRGSSSRRVQTTPPEAQTPAQIAEKDNQKKIRACITQLNTKLTDMKRTALALKGSKHPVAKVVCSSLKEHQKKVEELINTLQAFDVAQNYKNPVLKTLDVAQDIIKKVTADVKLANAVK
jgi:hypothetical protein